MQCNSLTAQSRQQLEMNTGCTVIQRHNSESNKYWCWNAAENNSDMDIKHKPLNFSLAVVMQSRNSKTLATNVFQQSSAVIVLNAEKLHHFSDWQSSFASHNQLIVQLSQQRSLTDNFLSWWQQNFTINCIKHRVLQNEDVHYKTQWRLELEPISILILNHSRS